jgi:UDP-N-acetylmuramoyl-tripeptide--D-alanyl-D-alanine ligase
VRIVIIHCSLESSIIPLATMARTVENPFKERKVMWGQYLVLSVCCIFVLWIVSGVFQEPTPKKGGLNIRFTQPREQNYEYQGPTDDEEDLEQPETAAREDITDAPEEEEDPDPSDAADEEGEAEDEDETFPELTLEEFPGWLHSYYEKLTFPKHPDFASKMTKQILEKSITMGCDNMVANMRPEGNFNYQYDFVKKVLDDDDMAVRQAGALWGLSMCWQYQPSNRAWQEAVEKGIHFYSSHMADGDGFRYIAYPDAEDSEAGANALFGLALIEYLRTIQDNKSVVDVDDGLVKDAQNLLSSVIGFLKYLQMSDLHFSQGFRIEMKRKRNYSSPYYDGEAMLCFIKAARYIDGYSESLVPIIERAAPVMAKAYTVDEWSQGEHDSDQTKGFYQWSSMLFTEYYEARYNNYELFGDYVIMLGHWIIHTHEILDRPKNTGYAHEGIISAYTIAKARNHPDALQDFAYTIDKGLYRLTQWQVGGPLAHENSFLESNPTEEKIAVGGIMNGRADPSIRIDTTQHQMHSLMLAATLVYN